ncbi:unnamed protein product [Rotaria sp. Silwood1]|nr:unnamed protein product [Rotaria sp. Silwood1]
MIDTMNPFNEKQLQLLSRGPTYVPPCLMYILFADQSINDIVKKQFAPLKHQLMILFQNYKINLPLRMEIQDKLFNKFENLFSHPIPAQLFQHAVYKKHFIQSIRYTLQKNNLILRRTANNMNTFYVGNRSEFEAKADQYLIRSENYDVLIDINNQNNEKPLHSALKNMMESMNSLLEKLKAHNAIKDELYEQLVVDPTKTKLPYLYFLADISNGSGLSLLPVISAQYSATWKIAKHLNRVLRPFVDDKLRSTTFDDDTDFIRKFHQYATTERRLHTTTVFCIIKITNFYSLDEHQNMIDVIAEFLRDNLVTNKLGSFSIMTIRNLLYLFLHNNIFYYKDKIYTFVKGSPNTMLLTETLSNVYLSVWEKKILKEMNTTIEFFGRHKNQLFFTWNKSSPLELETFIEDLREKHRNVRFQKLIGTSVHYLNIYLENRQGHLYSRIHYDPNSQRYILLYVTSHAKSTYSDWLRTALIHAVCVCTSIDDFQQERMYLELTFLTSGCSLLFVETNVKNFFNYFHALRMKYSRNQTAYDQFRRQCFDFVEQRHQCSLELQKFDDNGSLFPFNYIYQLKLFAPPITMSELSPLIKDSVDDCMQTLESSDQLHELFIQESSPLLANAATKLSTTDEYSEKELSQQLRTTDVVVTLFDCMQCYVKIQRCEMEDYISDSNGQTNLDRAIQEHREEQEIASSIQINQSVLDFHEKIYTFVKGSPNTMPLTETLSNVYLSVWEKKILKEMNTTMEFFGRHKNQLFFTWNKSSSLELETFIEDLQEKHRNVRFQKLIGTSVHYLNIYLENRQGHLYSRIHDDPNSDWLRTALIRAVCVCTSIDDFQQERMYLELTFLTSGYFLLFVETNVKNFFNYFHALRMKY